METWRTCSFVDGRQKIAHIAPSQQQHKYNDDVKENKKLKNSRSGHQCIHSKKTKWESGETEMPQIWTLICPFSLQTNSTNTIKKTRTSTTKKQINSRKLIEAKTKTLLDEKRNLPLANQSSTTIKMKRRNDSPPIGVPLIQSLDRSYQQNL